MNKLKDNNNEYSKRVIVINSQPLLKQDDKVLIYKETGKFLVRLSELENKVIVFQSLMAGNKTVFLSDYDLSNKNVIIKIVKRSKIKLLTYIKVLFKGFIEIRKADFIYIFFPTNIFYKFLINFSIILNKEFGLYIRGEKGLIDKNNLRLYQKAKLLLTISPKFTDLISSYNKNVFTIRPMISFSEEDIVTDKIYTNLSKIKFLYVGRIERAKGIFDLVEAVKIIVDKNIRNFEVNLVGDGEDLEKIKLLINKYDIGSYFIFKGVVTKKEIISDIYKSCNVFIFPSHHEGFPRVLFESMIFGLPIITTFVGSIDSIMVDKENCLKVDSKNSIDLADKIKIVIINYESCIKIAQNGTKTIIKYLSKKKLSHADQLNKMIKD